MKLAPKQRQELTSATIMHTLGLILACSALCVLTTYAADPSWWSLPGTGSQSAVVTEQVVTNDGVVTTNYVPNPYAAVTQGQMKQFTARAVDYLNANLSGGAGTNLNSMVSNWAQDYATNGYGATNIKPSDYTAMNIGQLKYIGNRVWSQLVAGGYTNAVPSWLATNSTDNQVANLGQLKEVFNFDQVNSPPAAPSDLMVTASNPGELDLTWSNNSSNATSLTISVSTDGGSTWSTVTTLTDPTINSYAVTGLSSGDNYEFEVTASNSAGSSATPPSSSTPSAPVSRYAVIDFGTNFTPSGLNNSGAVVGYTSPGTTNQVPAIWDWTSNTNDALPVNSAYALPATNYWAAGIDDAGNIVGQ